MPSIFTNFTPEGPHSPREDDIDHIGELRQNWNAMKHPEDIIADIKKRGSPRYGQLQSPGASKKSPIKIYHPKIPLPKPIINTTRNIPQ